MPRTAPRIRTGAPMTPTTGWSSRYCRSSGRMPARSRSWGTWGIRTTSPRRSTGASNAPTRGGVGPITLSAEATNAARSAWAWSRAARSMLPSSWVIATRQRSPSASRPRRAAYWVERGHADQRVVGHRLEVQEHALRDRSDRRRARRVGARPGGARTGGSRRTGGSPRRTPRTARRRALRRDHRSAPTGTRSGSARPAERRPVSDSRSVPSPASRPLRQATHDPAPGFGLLLNE